MRVLTLESLMVLALLVAFSAGCFLEGDDELEYAPVRPYAGMIVDALEDDGETYLWVSRVQEGHPAANAGVDPSTDLVVGLERQPVDTPMQFYTRLETHRPGDVVTLDIERLILPVLDGEMPKTNPISVSIELIEEPLPDTVLWVPHPDLREADHLRLGLWLTDITHPLADHFGLDSPEGVLVLWEPFPVSSTAGAGIGPGNVLLRVMGETVNSLSDVQEIVDGLDEDEPVRLLIRRDGQEREYVVDSLGPDVPGANQFPSNARRRLATAIERGDLHPVHVEIISGRFWRAGNTSGGSRIGAITKITSDSITLEVYSSGDEWSAELTPETQIVGVGSSDGLSVGEFVNVVAPDGRAVLVSSLSGPLPR